MLKEILDYYDYYIVQSVDSDDPTWCIYRGHPDSAWASMLCANRESAIDHALSLAKMCAAAGKATSVRLRTSPIGSWQMLAVPDTAQAA